MGIFLTLLGAVLIIVALRDIFNSLFHPLGSATVTRLLIVRPLWCVFRRLGAYRHTALESAGPSMVLAVIGSWVALLVIGWALIYWPRLPSEFIIGPELSPSAHSRFIDALYLSMTTLTTLGYGDITPTSEWLKIIAPLEAMVGFGLFTVSLSTVVSIYQVLRRRRTLAFDVTLLRERESTDGAAIAQMNPMVAQQVLSSLALQLNTVWNDLLQFPITYYFTSSDSQSELSAAMLYLLSLVEEGTREDCPPEIYFGASMLRGTIHAFTALLTRNFLDLPMSTPAKEVLAAYARDHLQIPST
jgi:hypothetical protein